MLAQCCPVGRGEGGKVADGPPYLKKQQKSINPGRYVQEYRAAYYFVYTGSRVCGLSDAVGQEGSRPTDL